MTRTGRPRGIIAGGCLNDSDYKTQRTVDGKRVSCPIFTTWQSMVNRCFSENLKLRSPTYADVCMVDEWKVFSAFRNWMVEQVWEVGGVKLQLDKDILVPGNKVYSPETCVFIPKIINVLLNDCRGQRGALPIGVSYQKPSQTMVNERSKPYYACIRSLGKNKRLGYYGTPMEAHAAWQKAKSEEIVKAVDLYQQNWYSDPRVVQALMQRAETLLTDRSANKETIRL